MADVLDQALSIVRGDDTTIVFTGTFDSDPSAWTMQFSIARNRGETPIYTTTSVTIGGSAGTYTATVVLNRATTSDLELDEYDWDLHRTTSGSVSIKANGTISMITPVYPPA